MFFRCIFISPNPRRGIPRGAKWSVILTRLFASEFGFKPRDVFLWIGMLEQQCSEDDGSQAEIWFGRGGSSGSNVMAWMNLSDFFAHLKMFNLCITAALQGLRLINDDSPQIVLLRLCLHVSESHSNLGNVSEAIRFMNVAIQDFHMSAKHRRRKDRKMDAQSDDGDVDTLIQSLERCGLVATIETLPAVSYFTCAGTSKSKSGYCDGVSVCKTLLPVSGSSHLQIMIACCLTRSTCAPLAPQLQLLRTSHTAATEGDLHILR